MRELKFRVWDKYCKRWHPTDSYHIFWLNNKIYRICIHSPSADLPLDAVIIQQYTGLKDRNGKEIYEGDIFKGGDYKWDAVEFEDGQFQVNLMGARVFTLQELCCDIDYELPEVIGNILENPELLE